MAIFCFCSLKKIGLNRQMFCGEEFFVDIHFGLKNVVGLNNFY
jgi:hypothetical protein